MKGLENKKADPSKDGLASDFAKGKPWGDTLQHRDKEGYLPKIR